MFDVGISEIALIGVVALVVLGPERLPKVARTAGHLFGRLQRYVANVKADINKEMEFSELAKMKDEVTSAAKSFEQTVQQHANAVESETRAVEKAASEDAASTSAPAPPSSGNPAAPTQAALIAQQEEGLSSAGSIEPPGPGAAVTQASPAQTISGYSPVTAQLQSFDLGVEPPRRIV